MDVILNPVPAGPVVYPDSDGKPMAENTLQYQWIVYFRENIAELFAGRPDVLVAADNLIYPVEGDSSTSVAPDVYVAIGRPAGHRACYRVWEEGGVFPQVVIEILSPNNTVREMTRKRQTYRRYGAEEYVVYDPFGNWLEVWVREGRRLIEVDQVNGWVSPRLAVRFDTTGDELVVVRPDGHPFVSFHELAQQFERERQRAEKLAAKLRELGVDPNTL